MGLVLQGFNLEEHISAHNRANPMSPDMAYLHGVESSGGHGRDRWLPFPDPRGLLDFLTYPNHRLAGWPETLRPP